MPSRPIPNARPSGLRAGFVVAIAFLVASVYLTGGRRIQEWTERITTQPAGTARNSFYWVRGTIDLIETSIVCESRVTGDRGVANVSGRRLRWPPVDVGVGFEAAPVASGIR